VPPLIPRHRPPLHWKWGVSVRKRWHRLRRIWRPDREIEECRYFGATFHVRRSDVIGSELILKRYEWLQIAAMLRSCRYLQPSAFIDVGANFGLYTCIVGRQRLAERLISFEPDRKAFELLREHLTLNGLHDAESHDVAVGAGHGHTVLLPAIGANSGLSKVVEEHPQGYKVRLVSLDETICLAGKPLAIKIDVEGFELPVLDGAKRLLTENYGYVQVESLDEDDPSVVIKMAAFGWEVCDRINADWIFQRKALS
jgi:FkbM family methyltransferase